MGRGVEATPRDAIQVQRAGIHGLRHGLPVGGETDLFVADIQAVRVQAKVDVGTPDKGLVAAGELREEVGAVADPVRHAQTGLVVGRDGQRRVLVVLRRCRRQGVVARESGLGLPPCQIFQRREGGGGEHVAEHVHHHGHLHQGGRRGQDAEADVKVREQHQHRGVRAPAAVLGVHVDDPAAGGPRAEDLPRRAERHVRARRERHGLHPPPRHRRRQERAVQDRSADRG